MGQRGIRPEPTGDPMQRGAQSFSMSLSLMLGSVPVSGSGSGWNPEPPSSVEAEEAHRRRRPSPPRPVPRSRGGFAANDGVVRGSNNKVLVGDNRWRVTREMRRARNGMGSGPSQSGWFLRRDVSRFSCLGLESLLPSRVTSVFSSLFLCLYLI